MRYVARGVTGVIAPWNFPLAIAAGMVCAALATGNAVVLKPAEQAPACAKAVVDALHAGGVPLDALSLLPGGDEAGKALVADPRIHTLVFTGSCAVGLQILEQAAKVVPGQRHLKRVIAEMGGKNTVIVDSDADLDDVVPALLKSAFAFAGQKCSRRQPARSCTRAIADELAERMAGAITTLRVGPAQNFGTDVPPVIDVAAQQRIQRFIASATPLAQAETRDDGFYVPPTIFAGLPADHAIVRDEIFGPVLSLETVQSIEHACDVVDESRVRAHRRPLQPQPAHDRLRERAHPGRQPLRQPRDHRRDGRPPALRRRQALRHRPQGRRPGLPPAVRRGPRGHREHRPPRPRRLMDPSRIPGPGPGIRGVCIRLRP